MVTKLYSYCGVAVSLSILHAEFDTESSPTGYGWILKQWIEVGDPLVTSIIMRPIGLNVRNEGARTNWSHLAQVKIHKRRAENESNFANCILRRIQLLKSHERCRAASQSESCPSTAVARFFSHAADERGGGGQWRIRIKFPPCSSAWLENKCSWRIRASFQLSVNIDFHAC